MRGRMGNRALLLTACVLGFTVAAAPPLRSQAPGESGLVGNTENGKRLFTANGCYSCHNYNGSGGRHGPRLSQNQRPAAAFIAFVRKPASMPAYSPKVMSDQELTDVWAYLRTLPAPPPVSSISILNLDPR